MIDGGIRDGGRGRRGVWGNERGVWKCRTRAWDGTRIDVGNIYPDFHWLGLASGALVCTLSVLRLSDDTLLFFFIYWKGGRECKKILVPC